MESDVAPSVRGLLKSDIQPGERELRWFEPSAALAPFIQRMIIGLLVTDRLSA
jgi:hypothetical protein